MKKILIIGGTQSFGAELAKQYLQKGFEIDVIGRSKQVTTGINSFQLDVANLEERLKLFQSLIYANSYSDIICTVGYARSEEETNVETSYELNVGYVKDIYDFIQNQKSIKNIITIGSQWSFKKGFSPLTTYIKHKHELKELTLSMKNNRYRTNHYCVPSMRTNQMSEVMASFQRQKVEYSTIELENPKDIAQALVEFDLTKRPNGKVYYVSSKKGVKKI